MIMETIAQEAKSILEVIPEENWCTGNYQGDYSDQFCSIGHIRDHFKSKKLLNSPEERFEFELRLRRASSKFLKDFQGGIVTVNDGRNVEYDQPTPKQRVMALLTDMITAGY
jgi:hypothetical protein